MAGSQSITLILQELADGDQTALDRLIPLVYAELRKLADGYLRRERTGHTLQPTALVHEAYFRLVARDQPQFESRGHFLAIAAQVMRQILVDHARSRAAGKRGGGRFTVSLGEASDGTTDRMPALIDLDDALRALERRDALRAKLIEMRFFGGLTAEESAYALNLPVEKVRASLRVAQAWLHRELARGVGPKK